MSTSQIRATGVVVLYSPSEYNIALPTSEQESSLYSRQRRVSFPMFISIFCPACFVYFSRTIFLQWMLKAALLSAAFHQISKDTQETTAAIVIYWKRKI
jgi:hypothetical protein